MFLQQCWYRIGRRIRLFCSHPWVNQEWFHLSKYNSANRKTNVNKTRTDLENLILWKALCTRQVWHFLFSVSKNANQIGLPFLLLLVVGFGFFLCPQQHMKGCGTPNVISVWITYMHTFYLYRNHNPLWGILLLLTPPVWQTRLQKKESSGKREPAKPWHLTSTWLLLTKLL